MKNTITREEILQYEDVDHMTQSTLDCFVKLVQLGVPAKIWFQTDPKFMDYRGFFWIDAEAEGAEVWLDYWNTMSGHDKLKNILNEAGLYFEWENSSVATVQNL